MSVSPDERMMKSIVKIASSNLSLCVSFVIVVLLHLSGSDPLIHQNLAIAVGT